MNKKNLLTLAVILVLGIPLICSCAFRKQATSPTTLVSPEASAIMIKTEAVVKTSVVKKTTHKKRHKKAAHAKKNVKKLSGKTSEVVAPVEVAPVSPLQALTLVNRSVLMPGPQLTLTLGGGNVYEPASGTNNWAGLVTALSYNNAYDLGPLAGRYEVTGKYGFNQIVYFVPAGGGGAVMGGPVNENRYDLEINSITPIVELYGVVGKFLLGAKYVNLYNPVSPTDFTGLNVGLVTSAMIFDRNVLLRGYYSLPLSRATLSPSIFGQPSQLFDYEGSIDVSILGLPLLVGYAGETMTLSSGNNRYYNMFFGRYFFDIAPQQTESQPELVKEKPMAPKPVAELPKTEPIAQEYVVKKGDSLRKIAKNLLGDEMLFPILVKDNDIKNPDFILPGWKLKISKP